MRSLLAYAKSCPRISASSESSAADARGHQLGDPSKEGVGTVAFSVAFILTLRWKVIGVIVTRFDNICNNLLRLLRNVGANHDQWARLQSPLVV